MIKSAFNILVAKNDENYHRRTKKNKNYWDLMCYTEKKLTQKGKSTMSQLHTEKQRKYFAEAILLHSKKYQQDVRQRQRSQ